MCAIQLAYECCRNHRQPPWQFNSQLQCSANGVLVLNLLICFRNERGKESKTEREIRHEKGGGILSVWCVLIIEVHGEFGILKEPRVPSIRKISPCTNTPKTPCRQTLHPLYVLLYYLLCQAPKWCINTTTVRSFTMLPGWIQSTKKRPAPLSQLRDLPFSINRS